MRWSNLFDRHSNIMYLHESSAAEVISRCERILEALKSVAELEEIDAETGSGTLPISAIPALKKVVPLVEDLERHMPDIKAWSVGYWRGSDNSARSTFFGCQTEAQASRIRDALNKGERGKRAGKEWTIEFMAVAYGDMVTRSFTAEKAVEVMALADPR